MTRRLGLVNPAQSVYPEIRGVESLVTPRSPARPVSTTSPVISWPSTSPGGAVVRPRTMCWSEPQMLVAMTLRITPWCTFRPTFAGLTPGLSLSSNEG